MLSISDWISFLSSERNANIGNIIGFSAFILFAFAVIMSVTNNTLVSGIVAALMGIGVLIIFLRTMIPFGRHARLAGRLLDDIMSGKERFTKN
jgi:phosphotransferase system  glucose/maltose/N-acetylglucosamine-specific IIC component